MERIEFCKGAKCAKLTITVEGQQPLILTSKAPALILEKERDEQEFTHDMRKPIEKQFPFQIEGIEFIGGVWYYNMGDATRVDCPLPGTYPIVEAGSLRRYGDGVTDVYWESDMLYCYFDGNGPIALSQYYPNNRGSCKYRVFGAGGYKFFDRQGVLYQGNPDKKLTYEVECDACCKDNEILCDHHHYPGYKCYPIPPTARRLLNGQNEIAKYWRYRR